MEVDMHNLLTAKPSGRMLHSPLYEYVQGQRFAASVAGIKENSPTLSSSAASLASEDSLDSIVSLSAASLPTSVAEELNSEVMHSEELETNKLIYRLCCSLYKKALQKTEGQTKRRRSLHAASHEPRNRNMMHMMDWMPILHLFQPQVFYARKRRALGEAEALPIAKTPHEASLLLIGELDVEKLAGGNSNHVYRLAHPSFSDKSILLRVYGSGDSEAIDRNRDITAMKQMSQCGFSPAVLHSFRWGRVEEYMDNIATCTTDMLIECPSLLAEVYQVLQKMHQLPTTSFYPEAMNKARFAHEPAAQHIVKEVFASPEEYASHNQNRLLTALLHSPEGTYYGTDTAIKVLEDISPATFERSSLRFLRLTSPFLRDAHRSSFVTFICQEIMAVRHSFLKRGIPLVFSHNDLNPGNILLSWRKVPPRFRPDTVASEELEDEGTPVISQRSSMLKRRFLSKKGRDVNLVDVKGIVFIDFEYADVNYRAHDLGNTICELDYDYSRGGPEEGGPGFIKYLHAFPPRQYAETWKSLPPTYPRMPELIFHAWQSTQDPSAIVTAATEETVGSSALRAIELYFSAIPGRQHHPATIDDVSRAPPSVTFAELNEVFLGMLSSHLNWSLWSFVMACNTDDLTNEAVDGGFAQGSSGLDYVFYGNCRLREYLALKTWMRERDML